MKMLTFLAVLILATSVLAEAEPPPVPLKKVPADGEAHHVTCKVGTYWIALPANIDPKKPTRCIFWCHGSNMNGKAYVNALKGLGYGENEILVGPNGHHRIRDWVYNFNAPNYDTKLAYGVLKDVRSRYKLGKIYAGGHSQGAYYTFRVVLSKPGEFAGAIPFAGGLLMGLDPKSAAKVKGKPGPPFAIIHGENDLVVDASLGDWAYEAFLKADYPCVRYYHAKHGHNWPGSVKAALEWILAVTSDDPEELIETAKKMLEEDRGSDAQFCLGRAGTLHGDAGKIDPLRKQILDRGREHAETWIEKMKDRSGAWAEELYDFRGQWGAVKTFAPVMKQLKALRKKHLPQATKQNRKAWKASRDGKKDEARELFTKTAEQCYTAFEYVRSAKRWLGDN
jgi:predicted esterase